MPTCNKMIRCWDNSLRPCMRPAGHTPNRCNPFYKDHPFDPPKEEEKKVDAPQESFAVQMFNRIIEAQKRQKVA